MIHSNKLEFCVSMSGSICFKKGFENFLETTNIQKHEQWTYKEKLNTHIQVSLGQKSSFIIRRCKKEKNNGRSKITYTLKMYEKNMSFDCLFQSLSYLEKRLSAYNFNIVKYDTVSEGKILIYIDL